MRPLVFAAALAVTTLLSVHVASAGNSDAAHACQQGGYASLQGSDGTLFKNAGECTAFAARGGTIIGIAAACTFVSGTSGCITYNAVATHQIDYPSLQPIGANTYTFTGSVVFSPVCQGCGTPAATGGGTFAFSGSSSVSGAWIVTGLDPVLANNFADANGNPTTCANATTRQVIVDVSLVDATNTPVAGGWIETRLVSGGGTPTTNFVLSFLSGTGSGFYYTSDTSGVTIAC
jgi:hypothetical protein